MKHLWYPKKSPTYPAGEYFHICNKSIARYGIFNDPTNVERFLITLAYYNSSENIPSLSSYLKKNKFSVQEAQQSLIYNEKDTRLFKCIAYCIMPDHYHLLVKILKDKVFSKYINDIENSYTRYFNIKFLRIGPLWQSAFRSVLISTNEQLLHVCRYCHLNPTTANLVRKPEDWEFSSYREYISGKALSHITDISIRDPKAYQKFCEDQIDYQKTLRKIKYLTLD